MKRLFIPWLIIVIVLGSASYLYAQRASGSSASASGSSSAIPITAGATPLELARAAFLAQGGEKFRAVKNMVLIGSVDLYGPTSTQSIPGKFVIVMAGERLRMEVSAPPVINFKQLYDGHNTYSSIPGAELPPPNKLGLPVLANFDQPGYTVTAIPDKKKQRGFRISDAEGFSTDFYVDSATGQVVSYLFKFGGYNFGVEHKMVKRLEGVLVPYRFSQRIELPQGAAFADFSVKEAKINQQLSDDVFTVPY